VSTLADIDETVAAATRAFAQGHWTHNADLRRHALAQCATILQENIDELSHLLSREQGKPLASAVAEINMALRILLHYAARQSSQEVIRSTVSERIEVVYAAIGVVGLIVPWNYPIAILFMKLGPALAAGNVAVIKPAPTTPLTTLRMVQLFAAVLPPGVLNTVTGEGDVGAALVAHPGIRKISFTGSTPTGIRVMQGAAATLKRLTLELGGNDAAIVLDDVDVDAIAPRIFASAFTNAGQICCAIKRLYVHRRVLPAMTERLAQIANDWVVGPGLAEGTQMGPLNNRPQLEHVRALVADAKARGARIVAGGAELNDWPGYFFRPTIVTNIEDNARLACEEQFGPALPLLAFDSEEEAVARANASDYGLGASVWSSDPERAIRIITQLDAGNLYVNQHAVPPDPEVPFGGMKASGFGHELGEWGVDDFSIRKVLSISLNKAGTR
jgi:acyl-CoA reductase-like NAD-dependent aldehyde dehydrogenase